MLLEKGVLKDGCGWVKDSFYNPLIREGIDINEDKAGSQDR